MHLTALGQHLVILGSTRAIFDVLDKRSACTSDRPQSCLVEL